MGDLLRGLLLRWVFPDPYARNVDRYQQARATWPEQFADPCGRAQRPDPH